MSLAYALEPAPHARVLPFPRAEEPWTAALLVVDARLAVAAECAAALSASSPRGQQLRRCINVLASARAALDSLFDAITAAERRSREELADARAYLVAACDWCKDVAALLREIAEADEHGWLEVRDAAASWSSGRVRHDLVARMAACRASTARYVDVRDAALRLQSDVVLLNWNIR